MHPTPDLCICKVILLLLFTFPHILYEYRLAGQETGCFLADLCVYICALIVPIPSPRLTFHLVPHRVFLRSSVCTTHFDHIHAHKYLASVHFLTLRQAGGSHMM